MQKTERVGAVALLFLLVTIVAVALWDDGEAEAVLTAEGGADPQADSTQVQQQATRRQRPQVESPERRDRHDGLRTTRATRAVLGHERPSMLGGAGQTAPLEPSHQEQAGELAEDLRARHRALQREEPTLVDNGNLDPSLLEKGYSNGRPSRSEKLARVEREAATPLRGRKMKSVETKTAPVASGATHVVRKNETLGEIAQRRLGQASRWPEIAMLNGVDGDAIREGQTLRLPGDAVAARAQLAPAPAATVPPRARAASAAPGAGRTYVIRSGDVLGTIAQRELGTT